VKSTGLPDTAYAQESAEVDGDGNAIHNSILLGLARPEFEAVLAKLEFVRLAPGQVLHEVGDTLRSAYFCNSGMVSILSVFGDGKSVEVGLVGKEGFIGLPLVAGFRHAATRAVVQIEGNGFRADAAALAEMLQQFSNLDRQLQQFSQIMTMELTLIAACNGLHQIEERLARWLLMCADRVGSSSLPLTQELLAQMLGARRASVTVAAGVLQKAGLIASTRGRVNIVDRPKLEQAACECYGLMRRQLRLWRGLPA
jgi:CRP-like cAMP-binding protein